jgi:hypothetical protein
MNKEKEMIAVCGLECHKCDILEATNDPKTAQDIVDWFRKERNEDVKLEDIHCSGCRGDRGKHWSADCWILQCCQDKKGLQFCHQCDEFACDKLVEWSRGSRRYADALSRLTRVKTG